MPAPRVIAERYQIESQIGEGGLGIVYRVLDVAENRVCALKVLPR